MTEPSFGGNTIGRLAALTGQRAPLDVRFGWGASRLNGKGVLLFDGDTLRVSGTADGHGRIEATIERSSIRAAQRKNPLRVELQCRGEEGATLPGRLRALAFDDATLADRLMAWVPPDAARLSLVRHWYDHTLGPYRRRAVASYTLLLVIAAYYLVQVQLAGGGQDFDSDQLVALGADRADLTSGGQWWRIVTANFMHGDLGHFAGNAVALVLLAPYVERLYGGLGMLVLFVLTGIFGNAVSQWTAFSTVSVGASGGIFGLFGALLAYATVRRGQLPMTTILKILVFGSGYALWQFALGLSDPEIDNTAHVVGWLSGLAIGAAVAPPLDRRSPTARGFRPLGIATTVVFAASLGLVAAVPLASPNWKLMQALQSIGERADNVTARCTELLGSDGELDIAVVDRDCTRPMAALCAELAGVARGGDERLGAIRAEIGADLEHRARRYRRVASQLSALPALRAVEAAHMDVLGACSEAVQRAIEDSGHDPAGTIASGCLEPLRETRRRFLAATDDPDLRERFVSPTLDLIDAEQLGFDAMSRAIADDDEEAFTAAVAQIQDARERYDSRAGGGDAQP